MYVCAFHEHGEVGGYTVYMQTLRKIKREVYFPIMIRLIDMMG